MVSGSSYLSSIEPDTKAYRTPSDCSSQCSSFPYQNHNRTKVREHVLVSADASCYTGVFRELSGKVLVAAIHAMISNEAQEGWEAITKQLGPSRTSILEVIGIAAYDHKIEGKSLRKDSSWWDDLNFETLIDNALAVNDARRRREHP